MKCIALSTKQVSENILLEIKCIYKSASAKDIVLWLFHLNQFEISSTQYAL